ncbi:MAG TPA: cytochrome c oxidase subunit 3 [Polyangiaceae bacterium]|jgi:cytochrome c oxidase subunit 3|nr:cytochrome c oxidase subunit 3 [Polyangiaceae bacterium]
MNGLAHAPHFESAERQAHAARLAMWVFLSSELLLFAGLFALYAAGRVENPAAFRAGVEHASKSIGSINTAILLTSSTSVAASLEFLEHKQRRACVLALTLTMLLGASFLGLKLYEYAHHFGDGIFPGGSGGYFAAHPMHGLALFWTLYFVSTGLHAIHVTVGLIILGLSARSVARGRIDETRAYVLENAALYWHLIDLIWIFLWPLYYLA